MVVNIHEKDWVSHIIIGSGIVIFVLIIWGTFSSLKPFLGASRRDVNFTLSCKESLCLTTKDNGVEKNIAIGSTIVIDLPQDLYPNENFVIIDRPLEIVEKKGEPKPSVAGNWAISLRTLEAGIVEILVPSTDPAVSDFYVIVHIS